MKKITLNSMLLLSLSLFAFSVSAENIENIKVTPSGNYLEFSWDGVTKDTIDQETHYALQWSNNLSDIRTDKDTSALTSLSKTEYRLQGTLLFEKNTDYYARVYTYYRENRQTYLLKGSKILKFKWLYNGNIESSFLDANDPTVVDTSSSTNTAAKIFGHMSSIAYDTSVQLSWATANEVFDKYHFTLSETSDLTSPIAEIEVNTSYSKALLTNLESNKKYYISGYLKRNGRKFGKGETLSFTTLPKFTADKQRRFQKYVLDKKKYGKLIQIGDTLNVTTPAEETTSTVTKTPTTSTEIKKRITELKKLISKYQAELRKLEAKTTSRTTTSRTSSTTKRSSLLSRLKNWRSRR